MGVHDGDWCGGSAIADTVLAVARALARRRQRAPPGRALDALGAFVDGIMAMRDTVSLLVK